MALAIASRWRCPPESVIPRSPMIVSYWSASRSMNSCACASRAARSTSSAEAAGAPNAMFSRTVAEKRNGSCEMTPIAPRSDVYRDIYEHGLLEREFAAAVEARGEPLEAAS